jgi:hypothetical protein
MPLLCSVDSIKYTIVVIEDHEFNDILEAGEGNYDDIYGFISNGQLKLTNGETPEDHWSAEIIAAKPNEYMIIIEGIPNTVDHVLCNYICMENDWYHQHDLYDIWQTPVGHIAVC